MQIYTTMVCYTYVASMWNIYLIGYGDQYSILYAMIYPGIYLCKEDACTCVLVSVCVCRILQNLNNQYFIRRFSIFLSSQRYTSEFISSSSPSSSGERKIAILRHTRKLLWLNWTENRITGPRIERETHA